MADNEIRELANKVSRNVIMIIDALVQRGAFKGEEMSSIGQLRDGALHLVSLVEAADLEDEHDED